MLRHVLPRIGYAAVGLLYVTVGLAAARIAFLGSRDRVAGMRGALRLLVQRPEGPWLVGGVAVGLIGFAAWRTIQTFSSRRADLIARAGWLAAAIGYGVLGVTALKLLARVRDGGPDFTRAGLGWLLASAVGRPALMVAGAILVIAGLVAVWQGASGRLPRWLRSIGYGRATKTLASRLARIGLAARGVVGLAIGYFLIRAVEDLDPREVREIGGSLRELKALPLGPVIMGLVAVGLVFYGVAMWAVALSRRPE
jgi:hypothetical protein